MADRPHGSRYAGVPLTCRNCKAGQVPDERGPSACCTTPDLIVACEHDFDYENRRYKGSDFSDCKKGCGASFDWDNDWQHEAEVRFPVAR